MKLRVLSGVALSLTLVPLAGLGGSHAAGAATTTATAYWVKLGMAVPIVPAGGVFVANDPTAVVIPNQPPPLPVPLPVGVPVPIPNIPPLPGPRVTGPTAIAAIRITGISPTADATLTLSVFPLSLPPVPSAATIVACPIVTTWTPPAGGVGDISKVPASNCGTPSVGRLASDFGSMSWLLPASFQGSPGELDIELQPGLGIVPVPAPFAVTFNAPTSKSVTAAAGGPVPPAVSDTVPLSTPASGGGSVSGGFVVGPPTPAVVSVPTGGKVTPRAVTPGSRTGPNVLSQLAGVAVPGVTDDRGHRIMAVVMLFMIAAALWLLGGRDERAPRKVGAFASRAGEAGGDGAVEAGIGRFRRPRTERARRL